MQTIEKALHILSKDPKNSSAWETIAVEVYQPLLVYVASLLLTFRAGSGETAGDIVHDIFFSFYNQWQKRKMEITSAAALYSYLRRSCRNLLVDKYRRERTAERLIDFLALRFSEAFEDESELYRAIFVEEIISKLPPRCSKFFKQYVSEDCTLAEIADDYGESPRSFYAEWYRCIDRAKEIFLKNRKPQTSLR